MAGMGQNPRVEPIRFEPIYQERVWGGRELERVLGRSLPHPSRPYGESWEMVDRPEAQSVVAVGAFAGMTLHELWNGRREELFGAGWAAQTRFPLLIEVLDARQDLSIQVHPPAAKAAALGGEPKTEMWFIADCRPGARLYAGLRHGVDRAEFEAALVAGTVDRCVHCIEPRAGDSIFIPSGRVHAIGAGFLIFEIQQNSDTTYRVFDWNRAGLDGQPRELHVAESLASIDFADHEPGMDSPAGVVLADCEHFRVEKLDLAVGGRFDTGADGTFAIVAVATGHLASAGGMRLGPGAFALLPKGCSGLTCVEPATALRVKLPRAEGLAGNG
jgi:mannose-6-phosphate isomerase